MNTASPIVDKVGRHEMSVTPSMQEQQHAYTRELIAMAGTGLLSGVVASGLGLIAGGSTGPLALLSFGALMGLASSLIERRSTRSNLKLVMGVMAGISMLLLLGINALLSAAVGGALLGVAMTLSQDDRTPMERGALILAHALALAAGMYTSGTLMGVGFLSDVAQVPVLSSVLQAGIWTLFLMLPAGLKHMQWKDDELATELKAASVGLSKHHKHILTVAQETYGRITDEIEREGAEHIRVRSTGIAQDVVRGLIALTRRSDELHRAIERTNARPLEIRAKELEDRIRATRDAALRKELVAALGEVVEQMRTRQRLETACARIEARQQRYLTALDKLHVTLVQNDSLSSTEGSLVHSLDELSQLTEQVRWQNLSVEELVADDGDALEVDDVIAQPEEVSDEELNALLGEIHELSGFTSVPSQSPAAQQPAARRVVLSTQSAAEDGDVSFNHSSSSDGHDDHTQSEELAQPTTYKS